MPRLAAAPAMLACTLLAGGLWAPASPAQAAGQHGNTAEHATEPPASKGAPAPKAPRAARPAAAEAPAAESSAPAAPKPIMTMDDLRQRLQDKIAQAQARQAAAQAPAKPAPAAGSSQDLVLSVAAPPAAPGRAAKAPTAVARKTAAAAPADAAHGAARTNPHGAHWSYGGEGGPARWGQLKPEFATCASGSRQSPIDIRDGIRVDLEPIQFDYRPVSFHVADNGHTVQANLAPGNAIVVGGRRYELLQFHFHRPSEEAINGRQFEMVAHLVHKDPEGRLAVVAVLMDQGKAHPMVQLVWNSLPLEQTETVQSPAPIDMNLMLPDDRRYFTYMGSLTTPPCSEGVRWLVLKQPATMSADQIAIFARLYPMNARPLQQAGGRLIKESN
jgi:carbonic anhydrase